MYIYYATQDGTSESFAKILGAEGNEVDVETRVKNLRDFSETVFRQEDNFVFVVSTHYEGNSPDDADDFNAWMETHPTVDFLKGKRFCVFGLGDSKYETFNFFSKAVHSFLIKNGAVE